MRARPIIVQDRPDPPDPGDYYSITSAHIEGNELCVRVLYIGGCSEHLFEMIAFAAPDSHDEFQLLLTHNAQQDSCKALIKPSLCFSLEALAAENQGSKRFVLNLMGVGTMHYAPTRD